MLTKIFWSWLGRVTPPLSSLPGHVTQAASFLTFTDIVKAALIFLSEKLKLHPLEESLPSYSLLHLRITSWVTYPSSLVLFTCHRFPPIIKFVSVLHPLPKTPVIKTSHYLQHQSLVTQTCFSPVCFVFTAQLLGVDGCKHPIAATDPHKLCFECRTTPSNKLDQIHACQTVFGGEIGDPRKCSICTASPRKVQATWFLPPGSTTRK